MKPPAYYEVSPVCLPRHPAVAYLFLVRRIAACGKGRLLAKNFRGPLSVWTFDRVEEDDPGPPRSPKPFLVP